MIEAVAAAPERSVKRLGWALLALALASPILMSSVGVISAGKAGELLVQVGFAWLAAAIAIDLLTRKRDAVAKANGRILAAAIALILAGSAVKRSQRQNRPMGNPYWLTLTRPSTDYKPAMAGWSAVWRPWP